MKAHLSRLKKKSKKPTPVKRKGFSLPPPTLYLDPEDQRRESVLQELRKFLLKFKRPVEKWPLKPPEDALKKWRGIISHLTNGYTDIGTMCGHWWYTNTRNIFYWWIFVCLVARVDEDLASELWDQLKIAQGHTDDTGFFSRNQKPILKEDSAA